MVILGVATEHCSSAALMINGNIIGAIQEERLTKCKNQVAFPKKAIDELIKIHLDGDVSKIDQVVFGGTISDPYATFLDRHSNFSVKQHIQENKELWHPYFYKCNNQNERDVLASSYWKEKISLNESPNKNHNFDFSFLTEKPWAETIELYSKVIRPERILALHDWTGVPKLFDHHLCHAYYAYFGVNTEHNLKKDIIFTADGWGDGRNWTVHVPDARGQGLIELSSGNTNLVARIYRFTTLILGMKPNEHEYKVMGLAPYSKSQAHINKVINIYNDILDFENGSFISRNALKDSYFDLKQRLEGHRFDNIAAGLQSWSEQVTYKWMSYWIKQSNRSNVFFSGGLSMNIKANGYILNQPEIDKLYIAASGGDESLSIGACFAQYSMTQKPKKLESIYLGSEETDHWSDRLNETSMSISEFIEIPNTTDDDIAKLLENGEIIARCCGKSEFGARALGSRSILASPVNSDVIREINDAIKNRDFWMPFTPSILDEYTSDYLIDLKGCVSEYMTIGFESTTLARQEIPAALHPADFSVRPQKVKKNLSPGYWKLINAFRERTGIAALLNTSLNLHGEPMNYSAADAARTVAKSALNILQLSEGLLIVKRDSENKVMNILRR
ncbi:MAG: hypothetical protein CMD67_05680 [Gammaproteobacteria bacterium]|nr:hypothetical protein [Gammaproteobacteria bacterium]